MIVSYTVKNKRIECKQERTAERRCVCVGKDYMYAICHRVYNLTYSDGTNNDWNGGWESNKSKSVRMDMYMWEIWIS